MFCSTLYNPMFPEFLGNTIAVTANPGRKSKDRPTRTPNVVFVVASHYQSLQVIVLLLQACLLEIYLFCKI